MSDKTLLIEKKSTAILQVTLNRPERRNAINIEMMQSLLKFWTELKTNSDKLRCVILTGRDQAFCAGADLKDRKNLTVKLWQEQHLVLQQAMLAMLECPIPIIAAVNGAAFGGGLELTLASDFAYAATNATFAQSEVKIGIMPGALGTQHLPKACGLARAKELAFTGMPFSAEEAFHWGIINKLCSPETLHSEVFHTAEIIAANAPLAIQQIKKSLNMSQHLEIKAGYAFEVAAYNELLITDDRVEGINAFNEKRKPMFLGK